MCNQVFFHKYFTKWIPSWRFQHVTLNRLHTKIISPSLKGIWLSNMLWNSSHYDMYRKYFYHLQNILNGFLPGQRISLTQRKKNVLLKLHFQSLNKIDVNSFSNTKIQGTPNGIKEICVEYNYVTCAFLHTASRILAINTATLMLGILLIWNKVKGGQTFDILS